MDLSEADRAELSDIGWHWGGAYYVGRVADQYRATRKGYPDHYVTADTAAELRLAIRSDYFAWLATLREHAST
jgi:hypothetical protein